MAAKSSNRSRRRPSASPTGSDATTRAHAAPARNTNAATESDLATSSRGHPERFAKDPRVINGESFRFGYRGEILLRGLSGGSAYDKSHHDQARRGGRFRRRKHHSHEIR